MECFIHVELPLDALLLRDDGVVAGNILPGTVIADMVVAELVAGGGEGLPGALQAGDVTPPCLLTLGTVAAPGLLIVPVKLLLSSLAGTRTIPVSAVLATPHTIPIPGTAIRSPGLVDDHTVDQDTAEDSTVAGHAGYGRGLTF